MNLLNETDKNSIIGRIENVSANDKALWGKMNVHEMLCHCSDQLKMAMGTKETEYIGKPVLNSVLKWLVLIGIPAPRGKIETVKELKQGAGGTKPIEFEKDKNTLISLVDDFKNSFKNNETRVHPAFGKMNSWQWGKISLFHLNHHLTQFSR